MGSTFNLGVEFSDEPYGRYPEDGPFNGQVFREEHLAPRLKSLKSGEKLIVRLDDGVESYGSSFLVEGFAGLVKMGHFTAQQLHNILSFSYEDDVFSFYEKKIWSYINESKAE